MRPLLRIIRFPPLSPVLKSPPVKPSRFFIVFLLGGAVVSALSGHLGWAILCAMLLCMAIALATLKSFFPRPGDKEF
jgi:hypothetical protein